MFALRGPPPQHIEVSGYEYSLERVFKHDFWAATCLYKAAGKVQYPQIVVKFGRAQSFCGLPLDCYGKLLQSHERNIYSELADIEGVPR